MDLCMYVRGNSASWCVNKIMTALSLSSLSAFSAVDCCRELKQRSFPKPRFETVTPRQWVCQKILWEFFCQKFNVDYFWIFSNNVLVQRKIISLCTFYRPRKRFGNGCNMERWNFYQPYLTISSFSKPYNSRTTKIILRSTLVRHMRSGSRIWRRRVGTRSKEERIKKTSFEMRKLFPCCHYPSRWDFFQYFPLRNFRFVDLAYEK